MLRSFKSVLALSLCLSFLATGCIGQMGLSGEVRRFNLEMTEDRWGREILVRAPRDGSRLTRSFSPSMGS